MERQGSDSSAIGRLIAIVVGLSSVLGACTSGGSRPERANESGVQAEVAVEEASVDGDGGVVLQIRSVGPIAATDTLITIHGGPGLSLEAMEWYESLAGPDRRVVSYDQRGAGRSTVPDDLDYRLDAQVADLEAIRSVPSSTMSSPRSMRDHVQLPSLPCCPRISVSRPRTSL